MTTPDDGIIRITEEDMSPLIIENNELRDPPRNEDLLGFIRNIFHQLRHFERIDESQTIELVSHIQDVLSVDDIKWEDPLSVDELFPENDISFPDEPDINILSFHDNNLALRIGISAQNNRESAVWFFDRLREVSSSLPIMIQNNVADRSVYFGGSDLTELADRWKMPIVVKQQGRHWFLLLSSPRYTQDGWRVLAYNPYEEQESWMDLPDYGGGDLTSYLHEQSIFANSSGLEGFRSGQYDLSIPIDELMAEHPEVNQAKRVDLQPRIDVQNCGPACLLMAAIRAGITLDNSAFKAEGKRVMEEDLSTNDNMFHILTREEILSQIEK